MQAMTRLRDVVTTRGSRRPLFYGRLLALFILLAACGGPAQPDHEGGDTGAAAVGAQGMVSSAHPLATRAGIAILRAGGNAFDAAVAVAAMLNVVEPMMSGMGGYGTILIYDAVERRPLFLNCSGRIPAAVDSDAYRSPTPNYLENRRGAKAVSTPGNLNAWQAMSRRFGSLPWHDLLAAAIRTAEEGFILDEHTAGSIARAFDDFPEHARGFYGRDGRPLAGGERLIQRDLAQTLRAVAQGGAEIVHGGAVGARIDRAMRAADGFLRLDDLRENRAEWWDPISIDYRGFEVVTASPPATAFPSLIRLGMMRQFDNAGLGHNSAAYLHRFAEVTKHAFWCRLRYAGDPEISPPPLDLLLSDEYLSRQAGKIDPDRAHPFEAPLDFAGPDGHTTHFVVADRDGNIVTATQTLGNAFGSRIMPEGTGIWLNNSLAYSTFEPKGNPMDAHAGHHKLSGDCPTLILRGGRPWAALGTPGGHTIGQTVPQMVINLIDFGMDIQAALAAPRISFVEPDDLAVEQGIPQSALDALVRQGHQIREVAQLGNAHGLALEYDPGGRLVRFHGAADPRGRGLAAGY